MKAIINRFNVELIPSSEMESGKLVNFFWTYLIKESDPLTVKHTAYGEKPSYRDPKVGTVVDTSFFNIWTGRGFLIPICIYLNLKNHINIFSKGGIQEENNTEATPARTADFRLRNGYEPRDYQEEVLNKKNAKCIFHDSMGGITPKFAGD